MLPRLCILLLLEILPRGSASALPRNEESSGGTIQYNGRFLSSLAAPLVSRDAQQPFTLNGTGALASPLGIEHLGYANIIENENRPVDSFILDGNALVAVNRQAACYISPDTARLHCGDIPDGVTQSDRSFGLSANGTLVYNGTADWLACPAQNPQTYLVYRSGVRIAPDCIVTQLVSGAAQKAKALLFKNDVVPTEDAEILASRESKSCAFHLSIFSAEGDEAFGSEAFAQTTFYLLGRRLGAGPNGSFYCVINSSTWKFNCVDKDSPELMENFHSIDFSINEKGNLMNGGTDTWVICKTAKAWSGPYDARKLFDSTCRVTRVILRVNTLAGHDCSSKVAKTVPRTSRKLSLRNAAMDLTPICPMNLQNTLFKSPILVIPVSSTNKTQALGKAKDISLSPTQRVLLNFVIPYTKPYYNKTCALLLLLPPLESRIVEPQAVSPGLVFSELEQPVNEQTTWDNRPNANFLVSKNVPTEIIPGKKNLITTFPCASGSTRAFMISTRGGLSLVIRQDGVPDESGLHLVPCA